MVEFSMKAEKKALKQHQAIYVSITRSRNRRIAITNENSSSRNEHSNHTNASK
ncbi:hypothetical protein ACOSQ2_020858 [Xanthoceras sorbifolium]